MNCVVCKVPFGSDDIEMLRSEKNINVYTASINFIIQPFCCADTIYSGIKPFFTIYCINLAVLRNYEIDFACEINTVELHIKYDGVKDLLEHLKEEVPARVICTSSNSLEELEKISFGNPIEGYTRCEKCNLEDILYMYLEMVGVIIRVGFDNHSAFTAATHTTLTEVYIRGTNNIASALGVDMIGIQQHQYHKNAIQLIYFRRKDN